MLAAADDANAADGAVIGHHRRSADAAIATSSATASCCALLRNSCAAVAIAVAAGANCVAANGAAPGALWGVYAFWCGAVQSGNMGVTFGDGGYLMNIWNNMHAVPLISWQPFCYDTTGTRVTSDSFTADVAAGNYDSFIDDWAGQLLSFLNGDDGVAGTGDDRRAYLRMAHEMNLNSVYPWGLDAGAYVSFWQHVHDRFSAMGFQATQLQWMWCPNNFGDADAAGYWPGADYVDWVCFDAYNPSGGGWASDPSAIVDPILSELGSLAPGKPVAVGEFGCTSDNGVSSQSRVDWVSAFLAYMVDGGRAQLVSYFDSAEYVVSGDAGFSGALWGHALVGSDSSNGRVMTDAQFLGAAVSPMSSSSGGRLPPMLRWAAMAELSLANTGTSLRKRRKHKSSGPRGAN
ncbi:hypothetical protein HK405_001634 [Cladochytrium tenue]|nr:hypothetical protein HK405_001634 [Cladochytrium tenue]